MRRGVLGVVWCVLTFACGGDETEAGTNGASSSSSDESSSGDPSPTTESSGPMADSSGSSSSSSGESSSGDSSSGGSSSGESSTGESSSGESSSSSSEPGSDTSAATQPTTASSSESSSTGESDSETDTDGDDPQYCLQECMAAADCCPDGVDDCPGEYPWNVSCTDGLCEFGGCTGDDDCFFVEGLECEDLGDVFACVPLCEADDDCLEDFGETCTGMTEDGQTFCRVPFVCGSDDDCQGFGVCDLDTGSCVCTGARHCPDGWDCAALP
jgi:hypothetical protein